MNGIHDMGGMHGFGPIPREACEPVFHADWERRMFAMTLAAMGRRVFNVDEFRRAIERIPPADYLRSSYYERWLRALTALLIEKGVAGADAVETACAIAAQGASASAFGTAMDAAGRKDDAAAAPRIARGAGDYRLHGDPNFPARFKVGERVRARNLNPEHHTRLPRYARGRHGVIRRDWGVFALPDTHAHGGGANPCHCYSVEFDGRELWGEGHPAGESVLLDLWEPYLEPAAGGDNAGSRHSGQTARARSRRAAARAERGKR